MSGILEDDKESLNEESSAFSEENIKKGDNFSVDPT